MVIQSSTQSAHPFDFWAKLQQLDLEPIAYQLLHSGDGEIWTLTQVNQAIADYQKFLFLMYCYPNRPLVPTEAIDRVWHHHILDTQKYAEDCQVLFNRFIHHFPYFGVRGEGDRQQWRVAVEQTQALFQEHFGTEAPLDFASARFVDCQPLGQPSAMVRPRLLKRNR